MKQLLFIAVFTCIAALMSSHQVSALGLKVAPLEYKTSLKENEVKKGYIDVSNPSGEAISVRTSVQAFKQINNEGNLQFYDNEQISKGIKPDLQTFELGGREAVRLFFTIDGTALPEGDVYGALFFTTQPTKERNGLGQQVRVGTIFSIINKTPGSRLATVIKLDVPFLQFSSDVMGTYVIKNTGPDGSGFYPVVSVKSWPGGIKKDISGPLVFAGRERSNEFSYDAGIGIHRIDVSFNGAMKSRWVVTLVPWMVVLLGMIIVIVGSELLLLKKRRKKASKHLLSTPEK